MIEWRQTSLPAYKDVNDLLEIITDYFQVALHTISSACINGKLPDQYFDSRAKEWSFTTSAYMSLLNRIMTKDFDYVDDLAEELSQFYSDLIVGYNTAKKDSTAHDYFLCAMRMMEDLMDYIYCCTGLPID